MYYTIISSLNLKLYVHMQHINWVNIIFKNFMLLQKLEIDIFTLFKKTMLKRMSHFVYLKTHTIRISKNLQKYSRQKKWIVL
jgi:hypothetical protein